MRSLRTLFIITICIILGATFTYAGKGQGGAKNNNSSQITAANGPNFVDKDGDGICDNSSGKGKGGGKGKHNRRGLRDGSGPRNQSNQRGPNFVDKNGDGVCDNQNKNNSAKQ